MTEFQRCIFYRRKHKKLTQQELADMIGLENDGIIKLENGFFVPVDDSTLDRLAGIVEVEPRMFRSMYRADFQPELKALREVDTPLQTITVYKEGSDDPMVIGMDSFKALSDEAKIDLFKLIITFLHSNAEQKSA